MWLSFLADVVVDRSYILSAVSKVELCSLSFLADIVVVIGFYILSAVSKAGLCMWQIVLLLLLIAFMFCLQ